MQFCTFELAGHLFGVEVTRVQEVIRTQPLTPVPLASHEVEGLINLRGQIVLALDLRRRLGLPDRPADQPPMNVVVWTDETPISLLVDAIGDVVDVDGCTFEPPPDTLEEAARRLVKGAYTLADRLLLVPDIDGVVDPASVAA